MDHLMLTCRDHMDLRWSCKSIAWSGGRDGVYNGCRNIFYTGKIDDSYTPECTCKADRLVLAPEVTDDMLARARAAE